LLPPRTFSPVFFYFGIPCFLVKVTVVPSLKSYGQTTNIHSPVWSCRGIAASYFFLSGKDWPPLHRAPFHRIPSSHSYSPRIADGGPPIGKRPHSPVVDVFPANRRGFFGEGNPPPHDLPVGFLLEHTGPHEGLLQSRLARGINLLFFLTLPVLPNVPSCFFFFEVPNAAARPSSAGSVFHCNPIRGTSWPDCFQ